MMIFFYIFIYLMIGVFVAALVEYLDPSGGGYFVYALAGVALCWPFFLIFIATGQAARGLAKEWDRMRK